MTLFILLISNYISKVLYLLYYPLCKLNVTHQFSFRKWLSEPFNAAAQMACCSSFMIKIFSVFY